MGNSGHKIRVPHDVAEFIRGLHPHLKRKVRASLKIIISSPSDGKPLRDELAGLRSFRVGTFRIVYRVLSGEVEIVAIGPRERIYEETYLLIRRGDRA